MTEITTILSGSLFWLIAVGVGIIIWSVRQFTTTAIEQTHLFKALIRTSPALIGALLALVPAFHIVPASTEQSMLWGLIAGSISQSVYAALRKFLPKRFAAMLGSKESRQ